MIRSALQLSEDQVEFADAVDSFVNAKTNPCEKLLSTNIPLFDSLAGGLPMGDVTILVGHVGTGKSTILRSIAIHTDVRILYLPLQDESKEIAAQMLLVQAGIDPRAFNKPMDALSRGLIEVEKDKLLKRIGTRAVDNVTESLLGDFAMEAFGEKEDSPGLLAGSGAILIDNLDMIEAHPACSRRSIVQVLKSLVHGSEVAMVVADDCFPSDSYVDELANARLVIKTEATDMPGATRLTVLRNNLGMTGGAALVDLQPTPLA